MIVHECRQGSEEWHRLRLGIPTASQFHRIITPKTLKPSGQRADYMGELIAEAVLGEPLESPESLWMNRGGEMETEARGWYELTRGVDVDEVGFITSDDGLVGGSPDGLVGEPGIVEIKIRKAAAHMGVVMSEDHGASNTQIHGLMWLTGREWCDVIHYNPKLPSKVQRVHRDEDYIGALAAALLSFTNELTEALARVKTPAQ